MASAGSGKSLETSSKDSCEPTLDGRKREREGEREREKTRKSMREMEGIRNRQTGRQTVE